MIRHLVFLRFADTTSDADKDTLYSDLADLSDHIDGILDFQSNRNVSVEDPLVRGFRDMFWIDFRDATARDVYLVDKKHQAIGARIVDMLDGREEGVFVCDIEL